MTKKRVLVIEDHPFQRIALQTLLKNFDHVIADAVGDADQALKHISEHPVDMVICDLNMPGIDGITLLRLLAEADFAGGVVISSAVEEMVIKASARMCVAYNMNFQGTISKPVTHAKLSEILNNITPPKEQSISNGRTVTDQAILSAFENNEFIPFYQPIVRLKDAVWTDCEALVRWNHPEYGILSPFFFLDRVAELGLTNKISIQVLEAVVNNLPHFDQCCVAVNISALDLMNEKFIDTIVAMSYEHPEMTQKIRFELTESDMVEHLGYTLSSAVRLCLRGFSLSVDDFGTGYSSFQLLDDMPFDKLKIDQSFISPMLESNSAKSIVETALFLANKLNMGCVSEGIESKALWNTLRGMSNGYGQGYFISPPLPVGALDDWHESWKQKVEEQGLIEELLNQRASS